MRRRRSVHHLYTLMAGALAVALAAALGITLTARTAWAATVVVQAESYAAQSGVGVEATADTGGGQNVAYLADGDWMRFDTVDLGAAGPLKASVRVASATGGPGTVELRTGSPTGPLLAALTTTQSLLAETGTSCTPAKDLSAYWIPTLYQGGKAIESDGMIVYYGSRLPDPTATVPFPQGFRMIAGNAKSQVPTPAGSANQFFCAGEGGEIGRSADGNWPICAPTAKLVHQLLFPDCWDGKHLDSPDHKAHVAFAHNGTCGGDHPVAIPSVSFVIGYPTSGNAAGFSLSSGMASSIHGDFFNAWDDTALGRRVKDCIVQSAKCNSAGTF